MQGTLLIGEVAARSGVSIDTVRYYERRDLLRVATRTAGGFRVFPSETVDHVLFIKQAQGLGFTLSEIATLLAPNGTSDCNRVHDLLDAKLSELDERMRSMHEFREKLKHYLAKCEEELRRHPDAPACPVIEEIAGTGPKLNCCGEI